MPRPAQLRGVESAGPHRRARTPGGFAFTQRARTGANPAAQRPSNEGALRTWEAALGRVAAAGLHRHARDSACRGDAVSGALAGAESAPGADDHRSRGVLGTAVSGIAEATE